MPALAQLAAGNRVRRASLLAPEGVADWKRVPEGWLKPPKGTKSEIVTPAGGMVMVLPGLYRSGRMDDAALRQWEKEIENYLDGAGVHTIQAAVFLAKAYHKNKQTGPARKLLALAEVAGGGESGLRRNPVRSGLERRSCMVNHRTRQILAGRLSVVAVWMRKNSRYL